MRVMRTLGHRSGFPLTPFYYRRESKGVRIESIVGAKIRRFVENDILSAMIASLETCSSDVYGVSSSPDPELGAPQVHDLISAPLGTKETRLLAYVTAVLVHEGTLILDHGPRSDDLDARVFLRRSTFADVSYATRHPES